MQGLGALYRTLSSWEHGARVGFRIAPFLFLAACSAARVGGSYAYGDIDGFLQVPAGGQASTTSPNRPAFAELGHDDVSLFDLAVTLERNDHRIEVGGQRIRLDGAATLATELTTGATTFPAGTAVTSDIRLDWYRVQYAHLIRCDNVTLVPTLGGVVLDFSYVVQDGTGRLVHRTYSKWGLRIGGEIEWRIDDVWSVVGRAYWGLPIEDQPEITTVEVLGRYDVGAGRVFLGIGYTDLKYVDIQSTPNHVQARIGPLILFGFEFRF